MSIPNYLTLFRILTVPLFFTCLVSYTEEKDYYRTWALLIFVIACITDALDGFIARIFNAQTQLGRFLDPIADKLLLLSGFLGLLFVPGHGNLPIGVTVAIVFRDIVILGGLILVYLLNGQVEVKPNLLGKLTTALQMATLIAVLLQYHYAVILAYLAALFSILSCISYVKRDFNKLRISS